MAKLNYFTPTSLDGFIADDGNFDWSVPSEEVLAFINDLHRPIGTYLYGRKEYETMAVWQTPEVFPSATPVMMDFARIWQAADKIVYLQIAGERLYAEDAPCAGIRSAGGARPEGSIASRCDGGTSGPFHRGTSDRRVFHAFFCWEM